jgi:hypothetical protein
MKHEATTLIIFLTVVCISQNKIKQNCAKIVIYSE